MSEIESSGPGGTWTSSEMSTLVEAGMEVEELVFPKRDILRAETVVVMAPNGECARFFSNLWNFPASLAGGQRFPGGVAVDGPE